ncbi:MAG: hypothetical protein M1832_002717 [Thelocarpon impressellum]|nr:MAG: hypothetical protein M1832_002717 [Thelocarpon impressellum]
MHHDDPSHRRAAAGNRSKTSSDQRDARNGRRVGDTFRPYVPRSRPPATHERPLLRSRRGSTPEQLAGMSENVKATRRFIPADDVSDSDEQEMEVDSGSESDSGEEGPRPDDSEGPPRKRQMQAKPISTEAGPPKWSNPDPYTALPPPDESQRKKKDVVKLIRKARVAAREEEQAKSAVADNDDFISLDFADDSTPKPDEDISPVKGSAGAPSGPEQFSHRQNLRNDLDQGAPGTNGATPNSGRLGPPPASLPGRPEPAPSASADVWPPPTTDAALGRRKRTHDDEIKENAGPAPKRSLPRTDVHQSVWKQWVPQGGTDPTPWLVDHSATPSMGLWLHKEICDFYEFVRPRDYEQKVRTELLDRLQGALSGNYGECKLHCFGSFAAGLYLPNADMDLVLISNYFAKTGLSKMNHKKHYYQFADFLLRRGIARRDSVEVIAKAKVPLVKFVDAVTGLKVDMSFENNTGVIANTTFRTWKAQFPAMPVIVTLVKQFLLMRGLSEVHNGGLGGFSVTCLVTSLLQLMPQVQSGEMVPERCLGDVLMEFFELYGKKFNTSLSGISLDPPGYFEKRLNPTNLPYRYGNGHRLSIVDPNRPDNDISGGSSNVKAIFGMFSQAHDALLDKMDRLHHAALADRRGQSILGTIFAGNYSAFDRQRRRLRELHGERPGPFQAHAEVELMPPQAVLPGTRPTKKKETRAARTKRAPTWLGPPKADPALIIEGQRRSARLMLEFPRLSDEIPDAVSPQQYERLRAVYRDVVAEQEVHGATISDPIELD